ncbi:MAG: hypothetical protein QM756_40275 [Polyangiaceae bacterium]
MKSLGWLFGLSVVSLQALGACSDGGGDDAGSGGATPAPSGGKSQVGGSNSGGTGSGGINQGGSSSGGAKPTSGGASTFGGASAGGNGNVGGTPDGGVAGATEGGSGGASGAGAPGTSSSGGNGSTGTTGGANTGGASEGGAGGDNAAGAGGSAGSGSINPCLRQAGAECAGSDFHGASCYSRDAQKPWGTLSCTSTCTIDASKCVATGSATALVHCAHTEGTNMGSGFIWADGTSDMHAQLTATELGELYTTISILSASTAGYDHYLGPNTHNIPHRGQLDVFGPSGVVLIDSLVDTGAGTRETYRHLDPAAAVVRKYTCGDLVELR